MPAQAPFVPDEAELLLGYLAQQRDGIRNAAFGLNDDQARLTPSAGTLSIAGLAKHVAATERHWMAMVVHQPAEGSREQRAAAYADTFTLGPDEDLAGVLADLEEVRRETEAIVHDIGDLDRPVPVPRGVPWFPADLDAWSLRWVLLHLIEETARHAGHADLLREMIDGATMYELMAAAEGWPATEWLKPWRPTT